MKPFLIIQLRPEDAASDNEYEAFLQAGGLTPEQTRRIRIERDDLPELDLSAYSGVIVGGGPYCVSDEVKPPEQNRLESQLDNLLKKIVEQDFPYLGACYGLGILSRFMGGTVSKEQYGEGVGAVTIAVTPEGQSDRLFGAVKPEFQAFGGHKEACQNVPEGAVRLAGSATCPVQAIRVKNNIYATQFHPELDGAGLALRINVYRHAGYFLPEEADQLIALIDKESVTEPEKILRAFIRAYSVAG